MVQPMIPQPITDMGYGEYGFFKKISREIKTE